MARARRRRGHCTRRRSDRAILSGSSECRGVLRLPTQKNRKPNAQLSRRPFAAAVQSTAAAGVRLERRVRFPEKATRSERSEMSAPRLGETGFDN